MEIPEIENKFELILSVPPMQIQNNHSPCHARISSAVCHIKQISFTEMVPSHHKTG